MLVRSPKVVTEGYDGSIHVLRKSCGALVPRTWVSGQDQITEWVY